MNYSSHLVAEIRNIVYIWGSGQESIFILGMYVESE